MFSERVSKLFLSKEQSDAISDLVIVSQKWLIKVMREVMELSENFRQITGAQQRDLKKGKVTLQALKKIWSESVKELGTVDIERLCYILQAYCLIHPVGASSAAVGDGKQLFIIPCMLPEATERSRSKIDGSRPWIEFCFDFEGFLPLEVYHRLLCMLLNESSKYELYAEVCLFEGVDGCIIKVELDSSHHLIKVFYV